MKKYWLLIATLSIWITILIVKFQDQHVNVNPNQMQEQDSQNLSTLPTWDELTSIQIKRQGLDHPIDLMKSNDHLWIQYAQLGFQKQIDPYVENMLKTALSKDFEVIQVLDIPANQLRKFSLTSVALKITLASKKGQIHFRLGQEIQKSDTFVLFVDEHNQPFQTDKNTYKVIRFNQRLRHLFDRDPKHWQALTPQTQPINQAKQSLKIQTIQYFANSQNTQSSQLKWALRKESQKDWQLTNQAEIEAYKTLSPLKISTSITDSLIYTLTHLKYDHYLEDQLSTEDFLSFKFQPIGYFEYLDQQGKGYRLEIQPITANLSQNHRSQNTNGLYVQLTIIENRRPAKHSDQSIAYLPFSQSSFLHIQLESLLDRTLGLDSYQNLQTIEWEVQDRHWRLQRIFSNDPLIQWQWQDQISKQQKFVSVNGFESFWQILKSEGNGFKYLSQEDLNEQDQLQLGRLTLHISCPPPLSCENVKRFEVIKNPEKQLFLMKASSLSKDPYLSLSQPLFEMIERYFDTYHLK